MKNNNIEEWKKNENSGPIEAKHLSGEAVIWYKHDAMRSTLATE